MKPTQISKRLLVRLIVFGIAFLALWINRTPPEEPLRVVRNLSSSSREINVLWVRENIPPLIKADSEGVIFATQLYGDGILEAVDAVSGSPLWKIDLPWELGGAVELLVDAKMVYVTSSTHMNAYDKKGGKLRWSVELGKGHVSIVSQLDGEILRVYYGDKIFEIDTEAGEIITSKPKEDIIWIIDDLIFRMSPAGQISAFDHRSKQIWNELRPSFFISDEWAPQKSAADALVIGNRALSSYSLIEEICVLNLQTGKCNWRHREYYISNIAIDEQSQLGYIMRDDFVVEGIDLETGNVLEEIHFSPSVLSEEMLRYSHRYSIALSDDVLAISFSDSDQVFGISLK